MTSQARYRFLVVAAIYSLVLQLPFLSAVLALIFLSSLGIFKAIFEVVWWLWCSTPVCATYAFFGARHELRRISETPLTPLEARNLRRIAVAGASATIIWLLLLVLFVGLSFFAPGDVQAPKDHIINDLNNLAADAYQYRNRPVSKGGGNGAYLGYQIPKNLMEEHGPNRIDTVGGYSYSIISAYGDSIFFEGRCQNYQSGAVQAKMDAEGKLINWRYFGDMRD